MTYEEFKKAMTEKRHIIIRVNKTMQIIITAISETMALVETKHLIEWNNDYELVNCTTTAPQMTAFKITECYETAWTD